MDLSSEPIKNVFHIKKKFRLCEHCFMQTLMGEVIHQWCYILNLFMCILLTKNKPYENNQIVPELKSNRPD